MSGKQSDYKAKLTTKQYKVLRDKATEPPFSGKLLYNKDSGVYSCAACQQALFVSDHKFDSGSGWPSFYNVKNQKAVKLREDRSGNTRRVEVLCSNCQSHLGHVFNDAPQTPTGLRFCINSLALDFKKNKSV